MREIERGIDPQLWQACAGSMVQIPPLNSKVFYFPQGHAEHSFSSINFPTSTATTPFIICRVTSVRFLADSDTDEVFAKIRLLPLPASELDLEDNNDLSLGSGGSDSSEPEKPASFAKTLTQSDANNGGGFSVPRYCAETIFPRLDYSLDPPVQTVVAKDVHGEVWKFRHIYRGTPRRHLLTTGWSSFVNQKKLVAGDSIVFLRAKNGDLCVGIRRAKKGGIGNNLDSPSYGWSSNPYGGAGFPSFLREDESNKMMIMRNGNMNMNMGLNSNNLRGNTGKVRPEMMLEAAGLAANGKPFEIVYYPRASTPEFCVKASVVRAAMRVHWCCGMRFKMAFETEDSSRISWFMGTVSSVQAADPIRWPNSPWRLLQVTWDEPDLLRNVKRVSPWLVELVSSMPVINLSPFSPPRKKLRLPQHLLDFPLNDGQLSMPSPFRNNHNISNTLAPSSNISAGIQGARHAHFGTSFPDFHPNTKPHPGVFPSFLQRFNPPQSRISSDNNDNLSCLLTMGGSSQNTERSDKVKKHHFLLFGQPIITEQNVSESSSSSDAVSQVLGKSLSDGSGCTRELQVSPEKSTGSGVFWSLGFQKTEHGLDASHCKVFLESEDVGRTLDLSVIGSYEELYRILGNMVGKERSELLSRVLYQDTTGAIRQTGEEPFSEFMKSAKRLTILMGSGMGNGGRTWITGMPSTENGLDASNKRGPLSIFA